MYSFLNMLVEGSYPSGFFIIIALICACGALYLFVSPKISRSLKLQQDIVRCEIFDGIRTYDLTLFCDSGNFAKDPFSGKAVTVVKKSSIDSELYNALVSFLDKDTKSLLYSNIKPRVIPIKTVSGTSLLYGFIPKSVFVYKGKKKYPLDTIIAIDTHENSFFGKDGIIPAHLLSFI